VSWTRVPGVASVTWAVLAVVLFALQPIQVAVTDPELREADGETASFTPDV